MERNICIGGGEREGGQGGEGRGERGGEERNDIP